MGAFQTTTFYDQLRTARIISIILSLSLALHVSAQSTKKYPFKVVLSELAYQNSKTIEPLDRLSTKKPVRIDSGGILLVTHWSEQFMEFVGPRTVDLQEINQQFNKLRRIKSHLQLSSLYSTEQILIRPWVGRPISYYYEMIFPPSNRSIWLSRSDSLCITWHLTTEDPNRNRFLVMVKNMFDEPLKTIDVNDAQAVIYLPDYQERFLIIEMANRDDPDLMSFQVAIWIYDGSFPGLKKNPCNVTSAGQAVMLAYILEADGELEEAHRYYQMATELSPAQSFKQLLTNFDLRYGKVLDIPLHTNH